MKLLWLLLFCGLSAVAQRELEFTDAPLRQVLGEIERQFEVRYSYADSVVDPIKITLSKRDYTLSEAHRQLTLFGIEFSAIDSRYYVVTASPVRSADLPEVVVTHFLSKGIKLDHHHFKLTPAKIEELPGVTDADLLLSLQQLPGIKSPNETASGLHVRGGTPDQNLILIDGIRLYHPGHLFGMISGINPQLARRVLFYHKATPSNYGDRLSGVIDIRPDEKLTDSICGSAGINLLFADASVRVPIVRDMLDVQLTARRSLSPWWKSPALDPLNKKVFQHTDFDDVDGQDFGFHDASARIGFKNNRTKISATGILIDNTLNYAAVNQDNRNRQQLGIKNIGTSMQWMQEFGGGLSQNVSAQYSEYQFAHDDRDQTGDSYSAYVKRNRAVHSGVSVSYSYSKKYWQIDGGYQLSANDVSHSFAQEFPGFSVQLGQRRLFVLTHSGFLQSTFSNRDWNLMAGIRGSYFTHLQTARIEPRLSATYHVNGKISVNAGFETRSQVESQVRETATNDLSLENYVWTLSDGRQYPLLRGKQISVGSVWNDKKWLLSIDGFYKTIDGVTSLTNGFMNPDGPQVFRGNGFARGAEFLVQRSAASWRAWMVYTWQDAQNRYEGLNGGEYFPTNGDIRHDLSLAYFKRWTDFSVTTGWNLRTGRPYSSLDDGVQSYNDQRLDVYHRLNVSAAYHFNLSRAKARAGISILNLYNRTPVINREFRRRIENLEDMTTEIADVLAYDALGFTPNVFFRISF